MQDSVALPTEQEVISGSSTKFNIVRILVFVNGLILYLLVSFQKQCPAVVTEEMAAYYGVITSDLGIFSSIFFYPYAVMQIFTGILVDILDPAYVIGSASLTAGIGAIICGASKTLGLSIFGRFFVGLGCGPTYVAICKIVTNWFHSEQLPMLLGIVVASAGAGGILASGPLAMFTQAYGWKAAFYWIGGIGAACSTICLIFVRGDPVKLGFPAVNPNTKEKHVGTTCGEIFSGLWDHLKVVLKCKYFWVISVGNVLSSGPYFDVGGLWGGPYLSDTYHYSPSEKGNTLMSLSIGLVVGSLTFPNFSTYIKSRKWSLVGASTIASLVCLVIIIAGNALSKGMIWLLLILLGAFTNPTSSVFYPLLCSYYEPNVSGTAIGCGNFLLFVLTAVIQQVSSMIIPKYGFQEGTTKYNWEGYKYGLWLICCIALGVSAFSTLFLKEHIYAYERDEKLKMALLKRMEI